MARSSTTRVCNGSWGGAKKGEGNKAAGPGRGNTHRSVAEIMAAGEARRIAADAWLAILKDPAHPKHAEMVAKAAERMMCGGRTAHHPKPEVLWSRGQRLFWSDWGKSPSSEIGRIFERFPHFLGQASRAGDPLGRLGL